MKKLLIPIASLLLVGGIIFSCQKEEEEIIDQTSKSVDTENLSDFEKLSKSYFDNNEIEVSNQEKLLKVANDFLSTNGNQAGFSNKKPLHIQPIYAYGIDGVAYYEVWFTEDGTTPQGWILISATDKDYPVVNFSKGTPYSSNFDVAEGDKVYRFGVSYFAKESNGDLVDDYGQMPGAVFHTDKSGESAGNSNDGNQKAIDPSEELIEGIDYTTINNYDQLRELFADSYFTEGRATHAKQLEEAISERSKNNRVAAFTYKYISGSRAYYTQIMPNTGVNTTSCYSGCANNAWANLYAWWDKNKSKGNLIPTTIYGETSPNYRNSTSRKAVTDPVQMATRAFVGTSCSGETGNTAWSSMYKGYSYAHSKGYGCSYASNWAWFSGWGVGLANNLTHGVADRGEPVLIGANSHFYVAYGWKQDPANTNQTWGLCYPGWSQNDSDDVWIHWGDFNSSCRITVN